MFHTSNITCQPICFHTSFQQWQCASCLSIPVLCMRWPQLEWIAISFCSWLKKRQCICRFAPSTHFAPTSSRSLRASYFRSEPIDIHLNNLSLIKNANRQSIMQVQPKKWIGGYRISFLAEVLTELYAFPAANFPRSIQQWYVLYQHQLHHRWRNLL